MRDHDRFRSHALTTILCATIALAASGACEPTAVPAISKSGLAVDGDQADPADPFGSCLLDRHEFGWFDCSQGSTTCTGWGSSSCDAQSGCTSVYHTMCDHTCQVDADCPVPATGDVRPVCGQLTHNCWLECDDTSTCPDGLTCQATGNWGLSTGDGVSIPRPFLCMQTLTVTTADGGAP